MSDVKQTQATYADARGAAAWVEKELPHEAGRNAHVWQLMDGLTWVGKRALDVGCGYGRDVAEMRRRGAHAVGLDVSQPLLDEAQRRYGGEGWVQGDCLALQTPPVGGPWDVIWSCAVLVHVPRDQMPVLLQRWVSWLAPEGRLVLITKQGAGEKYYENLGAGLGRVMVFYEPEELLAAVPEMVVEKLHAGVQSGVSDTMIEMILRKEK